MKKLFISEFVWVSYATAENKFSLSPPPLRGSPDPAPQWDNDFRQGLEIGQSPSQQQQLFRGRVFGPDVRMKQMTPALNPSQHI